MDPINEAQSQVEAFINLMRHEFTAERLETTLNDARSKIAKLKQDKKRREHFDGKAILQEFFRRHLHASGMSREIFVYECARQASKRRSVSEFVSGLFGVIGLEEPRSVT
jgi:hypothetical protein